MRLEGSNIVVLDLETLYSADDCRYCGCTEADHDTLAGGLLCQQIAGGNGQTFTKIGWDNKPALGLSIGCCYYYRNSSWMWFDAFTLEATMRRLVDDGPLLVSFNGIAFDFPLMRGILRQRHDMHILQSMSDVGNSVGLQLLCDAFKTLCTTSYDILAEIWKIDPESKFVRGLNSLDAIAQANGLPAKVMDGATAPRLWAQGRYAEVIAYNVADVMKTHWLFQRICEGHAILRGDGKPIVLPPPAGLETLKLL